MIRQGSSILAAVPIWNAFLSKALLKYPEGEVFTKPDPVPPPSKPMLDGQSEARPVVGGTVYPQIHSILYYVDRKDPLGPIPENPGNDSQFQNWEAGVVAWALGHVQGFSTTYNKPLPGTVEYYSSLGTSSGVSVPGTSGTSFIPGELSITNVSPKNGAFISPPFSVEATRRAADGLKRIELYWNRRLVNAFDIGEYQYRFSYRVEGNVDPQNMFELIATDTKGHSTTASFVVYH
jgi:hypothetical protein